MKLLFLIISGSISMFLEKKAFYTNKGVNPLSVSEFFGSKKIYTQIYQTKLYKIAKLPQTARGGGVKVLAETSAKNAFFYVHSKLCPEF